jgi:uncharacterized protein (DUF2147 family)
LGIILLDGFEYKSINNWEREQFTTLKMEKPISTIYLVNKNTMKIRDYIGISLIDRKVTWNRIKQ